MDKEDVAHRHTVEYYSAMKKNEIMPFAATWMQLEILILSEVSQGQIPRDHLHVKSKKIDTNGFIYKTEIDSQALENILMVTKGERVEE